MSQDLQELARRYHAGESEAFGEIYDHLARKIYRFIYFRVYDRSLAEDLTSQTFMRGLDAFGRYDSGKASVSTWFYRIARNLVIDYYRVRKKTVDISTVWDLHDGQDIEDDAQKKEQFEQVRLLLDKLKPEQREIVIMRIWQELSYREIAAILGKSEANCKMMFSRAIASLREQASITALMFLMILTLGR